MPAELSRLWFAPDNPPRTASALSLAMQQYGDGEFTQADLNHMTGTDSAIAWDVENSDDSKSTLGWRPSPEDPTKLEAFIQHRAIDKALMSETVFKPDGTRLASAWDVSPDNPQPWKSYVQSYDAQANLERAEDTEVHRSASPL